MSEVKSSVITRDYIPFNKPFMTGKETEYIKQAVENGKISGDGWYTNLCHRYFQEKYGFKKALLTTSCTDALEMAAILAEVGSGDEVIVPSFTFVSTANAFVLRGARVVFADSLSGDPNMDPESIRKLITPKTKVIVPVHYAGFACNMDEIMQIAKEHDLIVIEDAAQAIDNHYHEKPLGSFGAMAAFSFHETKNIISGEGGMLVINDESLIKRAEIIREKGTNRSAFFRGEIDKYNWVDIGSSFLPSDIIAAFLFAQLENLGRIQNKRRELWNRYAGLLFDLQKEGHLCIPTIPSGSGNNAHMFYILCKDLKERTALMEWLKERKINAVFHYQPLHLSPYYAGYTGPELRNSVSFSDRLLRLPLFYELTPEDQLYIASSITAFYKN